MIGRTGANFDYFWSAVADFLRQETRSKYYSVPVPEGEGIRMYATEHAFPDIPPLYIYYRPEDPYITFLGVSPAWSRTP